MEAKFTYAISSMGCKANLTDSQALESQLQALGGIAVSEDAADLFVLNTCTVTDQADRDAKKILNKSKAKFTVATGCMAEVDSAALANDNKNLVIVRNSAKNNWQEIIANLLNQPQAGTSVEHGERAKWHSSILPNVLPAEKAVDGQSTRTRAFYKFQDGCNAFCSYCIIPHARGRSRSLPVTQVCNEIQTLADSGIKEVVLTAIHAADYEHDGVDFTGLVRAVLEQTTITRLRLTSLDPAEISDSLIELMKNEPRLCPHFHVSLQSADSEVLSQMKRQYNAEKVRDRLLLISKALPHAYVGMDVIVGFPTETPEQFENGFQLLKELPWTKAHVFPYSTRKSTAAARLVENGIFVSDSEKSRRAKAMRALSEEKMNFSLACKVGSMQEVLMEEKRVQVNGRNCSFGHTRGYHKVVIPGLHKAGTLARVNIVGFEKDYLKGELR